LKNSFGRALPLSAEHLHHKDVGRGQPEIFSDPLALQD